MADNRPASLQLIDPVLTDVALRYESRGFIADQLLPTINVSLLSGKYPTFDKYFWFSNETDNKKADRSPTKEIDYTFSTSPYLCEEYALKVSITDLERQQADAAVRLEASKVDFLMLHHRLAREVRVATMLKKTSTGQLNLGAAPSVNWDQDTATIEADITTASNAIYDATGLTPNTIVIPYKVAVAMAQQQDIRALMQYTVNGQTVLAQGEGILPPQIWGLNVLIPRGPQVTTSNEGAASATYSEVWGDDVRVLYVDKNATWGTPSVAYNFQHTGDTVTRWRNMDPDIDYVRVMHRVDEVVVAPDLGYEIQDVLS